MPVASGIARMRELRMQLAMTNRISVNVESSPADGTSAAAKKNMDLGTSCWQLAMRLHQLSVCAEGGAASHWYWARGSQLTRLAGGQEQSGGKCR